MATPSSSFLEREVVVLSRQWHLRPDGPGSVVYPYSHDESKLLRIGGYETVALALCDGRASLGEIRDALCEALALSAAEAEGVLSGLLERSRRDGPFLVRAEETTDGFTRLNVARVLTALASAAPASNEAARLEAPLSLVLFPTYHCETDCIYCYAERPALSGDAHLSPERWVEILEEAGDLGVDLLGFSGGDPLTYPGIDALLRTASRLRMNYLLPTKTLVTAARARQLAELLRDCGSVQVSLDSFDPEVAAFMTRRPDYAERARQSITNLRAAGLDVRTNTVVTPYNLSGIETLLRELRELGVVKAHLTNYYRTNYRHNDSFFLTPEQMEELNATVARLKEEFGWRDLVCTAAVRDFRTAAGRSPEAWAQRANCSGGFSSCTLLPDGDVVLCEQVPDDARFVVGSVARRSLREVWDSPELLRFIVPERSLFEGTPCAACDEFDDCHRVHGRCFRDAYFNYGRVYAPSPSCPRAGPGLRHG